MIGPSCAVADVQGDHATIWSGSQWPQGDRADVAEMLGLPRERVQLILCEASGSYGRLAVTRRRRCGDYVAIVGRPVRVQWMRGDEWELVSPAMAMTIDGAIGKDGRIIAFDYLQYSSTHSTGEKGNQIAWHLIGGAPGSGRLNGNAAKHFDTPSRPNARATFTSSRRCGRFICVRQAAFSLSSPTSLRFS
jgi:hypothetical protein